MNTDPNSLLGITNQDKNGSNKTDDKKKKKKERFFYSKKKKKLTFALANAGIAQLVEQRIRNA